jgi:hypothetical protein
MRELFVIAAVLLSPAVATADPVLPPSPTAPVSTAPVSTTQPALPAQNVGQPLAASGNASAPPQQGERVSENTVVCHLTPATTGTRFGAGKVCRTILEWKQLQADAQQTTRHIQRMGLDDRVIGKSGP